MAAREPFNQLQASQAKARQIEAEKEFLRSERLEDLDNICDECKEEHESVSHNLILMGFKICNTCRTAKTIFPI